MRANAFAKTPRATNQAALGMGIHLAVGLGFGAVFGLIAWAIGLSRAAIAAVGVVFGLLVLLLDGFVLLPVAAAIFGAGKPISDMATIVGWGTFTLEHAIYGLGLGLMSAVLASTKAARSARTGIETIEERGGLAPHGGSPRLASLGGRGAVTRRLSSREKEVVQVPKAAVLVLADTETHEDLGRAVNALIAAREFKDSGDEVRVIFDGAGTKWVKELVQPDHRAHPLYEAVRDRVAGACAYCAGAFGVEESVEENGVPMLDEYDHHPSLRTLVAEGFEVLTF